MVWRSRDITTVYHKKYAHGYCFAVLCCGYTLTDFPISIRLTSLALWQSNDCPSASKATLMNMDKYFMLIHYERLHNHNKAKHNKTVCKFLGIYCIMVTQRASTANRDYPMVVSIVFRAWMIKCTHMTRLDVIVHPCSNDLANPPLMLTHWGRVTHICVSKLAIIGSDNGLSPGRCQAIIWTNAGILLIEPLGTNFNEILIGIQIFSFKIMRLKMSSAKWRPFCLGLNVLMHGWVIASHSLHWYNYVPISWYIRKCFSIL